MKCTVCQSTQSSLIQWLFKCQTSEWGQSCRRYTYSHDLTDFITRNQLPLFLPVSNHKQTESSDRQYHNVFSSSLTSSTVGNEIFFIVEVSWAPIMIVMFFHRRGQFAPPTNLMCITIPKSSWVRKSWTETTPKFAQLYSDPSSPPGQWPANA